MPRLRSIPAGDLAFKAWWETFAKTAIDNAEALKLTPAQTQELAESLDRYSSALSRHTAIRAAAMSATAAKNDARISGEELLSRIILPIKINPDIPETLKVALQIQPADGCSGVNPVVLEAPRLHVTSQIGQVIINWGTSPNMKGRNRKPKGVIGCMIYRKKGLETDFSHVYFSAKSPFIDQIAGAAEDYTYVARYVVKGNRETGPQSNPATIAARGTLLKAA